jgi:hypothetical protein
MAVESLSTWRTELIPSTESAEAEGFAEHGVLADGARRRGDLARRAQPAATAEPCSRFGRPSRYTIPAARVFRTPTSQV